MIRKQIQRLRLIGSCFGYLVALGYARAARLVELESSHRVARVFLDQILDSLRVRNMLHDEIGCLWLYMHTLFSVYIFQDTLQMTHDAEHG